jgi:hypothetical protein
VSPCNLTSSFRNSSRYFSCSGVGGGKFSKVTLSVSSCNYFKS